MNFAAFNFLSVQPRGRWCTWYVLMTLLFAFGGQPDAQGRSTFLADVDCASLGKISSAPRPEGARLNSKCATERAWSDAYNRPAGVRGSARRAPRKNTVTSARSK